VSLMLLSKGALLDIPAVSSYFARNALVTTRFNDSCLFCVPTFSSVFIVQVNMAVKIPDNARIQNRWKVEIDSVSCVAFGHNGHLLVLARDTRLFVLRFEDQQWKQMFSHDMHFYPRALTVIYYDKQKFDILISGACGVVILACDMERNEPSSTKFLQGTCGHSCCCLVSHDSRIIAAATTDGRAAVWLRDEETFHWKPVSSLMPVRELFSLTACDRIVDAALCYLEEEQLYFLALAWWNGAVLVYKYTQDLSSSKLQWSREACTKSHAWKDISCGYLTWHCRKQQLMICTEPFRISILDVRNGTLIQNVFFPPSLWCQGISCCEDYLFLLCKNMNRSKRSSIHCLTLGEGNGINNNDHNKKNEWDRKKNVT